MFNVLKINETHSPHKVFQVKKLKVKSLRFKKTYRTLIVRSLTHLRGSTFSAKKNLFNEWSTEKSDVKLSCEWMEQKRFKMWQTRVRDFINSDINL